MFMVKFNLNKVSYMKKSTKPRNLKDIIIISLVVFNFIVSIFAIFLGVQFYIQKDALTLFSPRPQY